jgi:hypothetical protein
LRSLKTGRGPASGITRRVKLARSRSSRSGRRDGGSPTDCCASHPSPEKRRRMVHPAEKCAEIVGKAARMAAEILLADGD